MIAAMLVRVVVTLHLLQAITRAAQPAERPWRRAPGRAAAGLPAADLTHSPGRQLRAQPPVRGATPDIERASRGRRGAPRRRGQRGGVNWRRHGNTGSDLLIGHLNIQSYKPKLPDIRHDIQQVYGFHVLSLCETWLTPNVPDRLLSVSGYKLYRRDRPAELKLPRGKGGVAVLVREEFSSELIPTPVTGVANSNLEILWVRVHTGRNQSLLVASAYRVPANTVQQLSADLDDLECQIQFMLARFPRATVVITGDFNNCLLRARRARSPCALSSLFATYDLHIANVSVPTYRPAASLLDVIATNRRDLVRRAGVTRCHYGGPHDFTRVLLTREANPVNAAGSAVYRRSMSRVDFPAFNLQLYAADWLPIYSAPTTDTKWDRLRCILTAQLDTVAPLRRVRERRPAAVPVTPETQQLLRDRRAALGSADRVEYKRLNRLCRAAVRADSRARYEGELARGGRAALWRVLRPVIGRKQQQSAVPNITPDALNDYYATIGPRTADGVPAPASPVTTVLPRVLTCSFRVGPVSMDDLYSALITMKSSSSTGLDGISVYMLQRCFNGMGHALLDVVNSSLVTGTVPSEWKHALVTPIPKDNMLSRDPSDTRPISLLPAVMKVVERVVQGQLSGYLEQHALLADAQHGYRKHRSTETALHVITDRVLHAMDRGDISVLVLLDLSKCFDVVSHAKLLSKLALYGIDTEWFRSYLSGHTQQVRVQSTGGRHLLSRTRMNSIGVFQGGALSCVLYMLFANDLSLRLPSDVTIVQYADDTQLLVSGRKCDIQRLIGSMEDALCHVYDWFCHNGMKLNAKKTQMIVLGTPAMLRTLPPVVLRFCGDTITDSREVKNLGVYIDRHLNFEAHVTYISRKCTGILIGLSHARHVLPKQTLKVIVEALAMSVVRYCLSVYGTCGVTQLGRIQKVVHFCVRVVTGKRRFDHVSGELQRLRWLNAEQLASYHTVCALARIIETGQPEYLYNTIGPRADQRHAHATRQSGLITCPNIRTEAGRRRMCFRGVRLLNSVRAVPGEPGFRRTVRRLVGSAGAL